MITRFNSLGSLGAFTIFLILIGCGDFFCRAQEKLQGDSLVMKLGKGFVSDTATVNGTTLHYIRDGAGPALILIHGFAEDWYEWHKIIPRPVKKFTGVAVDLRGIDGSKATPAGYDAANMAEDIHQLVCGVRLLPGLSR
jgi:alpha/beta hydrolase fold